jgi:hypothetical protein
VAKYAKDTKFGGLFEWVWQCGADELASKELVVEYALLRLKKKTLMCFIAGNLLLSLLSPLSSEFLPLCLFAVHPCFPLFLSEAQPLCPIAYVSGIPSCHFISLP